MASYQSNPRMIKNVILNQNGYQTDHQPGWVNLQLTFFQLFTPLCWQRRGNHEVEENQSDTSLLALRTVLMLRTNVKFSPLSYRLHCVSIAVLQHSYSGLVNVPARSAAVLPGVILHFTTKEYNKLLTVCLMWSTVSQRFSPMENTAADHLVNLSWHHSRIFDSETFPPMHRSRTSGALQF